MGRGNLILSSIEAHTHTHTHWRLPKTITYNLTASTCPTASSVNKWFCASDQGEDLNFNLHGRFFGLIIIEFKCIIDVFHV